MDDGQKGVMRTALEMQFRYKFYQDITFPYLQSIGIRDVFQGFGNDEVGFIGMLHLWWIPEESNIHYDNPRKFPVKIIGFWKGEWFDTPEEGLKLAEKIENDRPYDTGKLIKAHMEHRVEQHETLRAETEMKELIDNGFTMWN
jgi:hypothetical protein